MSQPSNTTAKARILIVEDDTEVNAHLTRSLQENGYAVESTHSGSEGLALAQKNTYDILLLDRMLPQVDGLTILSTIRKASNTTPVLILSALGNVDDRVEGLKAGGDDYLIKPFALVELQARIEALLRRGQPHSHSEIVLSGAGITIDLLARKVTCDGKDVALQAREFKLLEFLLRHKNQIVTRTMLLEHVWNYHFDPQTNVIDVHISRLRQKIDADPSHSRIKTLRGEGYIIEDKEPALR